MVIERELSFVRLCAQVTRLGKDCHILLTGGEGHIGCAVLALPRLSLTGNGRMSATASVLNVTGHKDEEACRYLAERVCSATGAVTACCGGIHVEGITPAQIDEVMEALRELAGDIAAAW